MSLYSAASGIQLKYGSTAHSISLEAVEAASFEQVLMSKTYVKWSADAFKGERWFQQKSTTAPKPNEQMGFLCFD